MWVHSDWLLLPERAAVHVPTGTAVVADLHLGYCEARRRAGEAVPASSLGETCQRLRRIAFRREVGRFLFAGDVVESLAGADVLKELLGWFGRQGLEFSGLVPGNHDRALAKRDLPTFLLDDEYRLGDWRVVHGDGPLPRQKVVAGHFHPCLRWHSGLAAPCFLIGARHLILPAFSFDARGVNVLSSPRWQTSRCAAVVGDEVLDFGPVGEVRKKKAKGIG